MPFHGPIPKPDAHLRGPNHEEVWEALDTRDWSGVFGAK